MAVQTGVQWITGGIVLGIGASRVVTLLADLPAHRVPDLVQVLQAGLEHRTRVAPNLDFAFAGFQGCVLRAGLAHHMTEPGQRVIAQGLHHFIACIGSHLNDNAQFFIKQRLERQLFAAPADLACPVLAVAGVHSAVADAIAFEYQCVNIE